MSEYREPWPDVPDAKWLRDLADNVFGEHHRQRDTHNKLHDIAARIEARAADQPSLAQSECYRKHCWEPDECDKAGRCLGTAPGATDPTTPSLKERG